MLNYRMISHYSVMSNQNIKPYLCLLGHWEKIPIVNHFLWLLEILVAERSRSSIDSRCRRSCVPVAERSRLLDRLPLSKSLFPGAVLCRCSIDSICRTLLVQVRLMCWEVYGVLLLEEHYLGIFAFSCQVS